MRIAIAGAGRLAVASAEPLLASHHEIVAVLLDGGRTRPEARTGFRLRKRFVPASMDLASFALRHRIPLVWIDRMDTEELDALRALDIDLVYTAGFSIIFNEDFLAIPNIGCVNAHPSLLPKHRGASPFAHVILDGESETGVTCHVMTPEIDAGNILAEVRFAITPLDTSITLYYKACNRLGALTADLLDDIEERGIEGVPQDTAASTYDPRMTQERAAIDWSQPANHIERQVRAALAYTPAWFRRRNRVVHVTRATFDPRTVDAAPGVVLERRPYPVVATGAGRLIIHSAYTATRIPVAWPALWSPLRRKELLPSA